LPAIVVFDGACNLCNGAVRFILKHDRKGMFQFAWLQSPAGQASLAKSDIDAVKADSIVLVDGEKVYTRSDAVLHILELLGGGWKLFRVFRVIPKAWRDSLYDFIARNRYRWFGKKDACELPDEVNFREKFLDAGE